jgi:hypothetical protein
MLTISDEALSMIETKSEPIYLDMPKTITSCCFDFQECPTIRFGTPHNINDYEIKLIREVNVYVPHRLPENPLEIAVSNFLGFKKLVIKGWQVL